MLAVGEAIHDEMQLNELPPGSRIHVTNDRSQWYEKNEDGDWYDWRGEHAGSFSMGGFNTVEVVGPAPSVHKIETVEQYMWRYRQIALRGVRDHGVSYSASIETLAEIGVGGEGPWDIFPLGKGVKIRNRYDRDRLPDGTVVFTGNPDGSGNFGVFRKERGQFRHILGQRTDVNNTCTIESINNDMTVPEWLTKEGTEDDLRQIIAFKKKAYNAGKELARQQGWCGTYDAVVSRAGVDRSVLRMTEINGTMIGQQISASNASHLPQGTLLLWQNATDPTGHWSLFVRDDSMTNNRGRTRKVLGMVPAGAVDNENVKRNMVVAGFPDAETGDRAMQVELPHLDDAVWNQIPYGTVLVVNGESFYRMAQDHRVNGADYGLRVRGDHVRRDFGRQADHRHIKIASIPVPAMEVPE